ncbi:MAG: hypothetical protein WBA46_17760 [Thermomicrobiales bacterium]
MTCEISPIAVVIKAGQTVSTPFSLGNAAYAGIIYPAVMDGTTLKIEVSAGSFQTFVPQGSPQVSLTIQPGVAVDWIGPMNSSQAFSNYRFVAATVQAADRLIWIVGKG